MAHVPVMHRRSAAATSVPNAAVCSSTARSALAATRAPCSKPAPTAFLGLDRDLDALARAREALAPWSDRVELVHADYRALDEILDRQQIARVDGTLADLGVSSLQFDTPGRGFSFQRDEPLDMRMDRSGGETAADLVARSTERELADAIFTYRRRALFAAHRARDRRGAAANPRSTRPAGWRRSSAARFRAADSCGSIRRRARFRRCASG